MIYYDGIINKLQKSGGISILFDEIVSRLPLNSYKYVVPEGSVKLKRYFPVSVTEDFSLFHSTYYRVPNKRGIDVVTTVHDFTYEKYIRGGRQWIHSWQKRKAIAAADKIICVSLSTKNDLLEFFGAQYEEKITVVHNGVSKDYFPDMTTKKIPQVLFVGARSGYKNFKAVVSAISAIAEVDLVCVGGGEFTRQERDCMDKTIPGRYRHAGFINNRELNIEYNRSVCLLYPSLYEGFGIPILEAMRAGCAVVAVNASSIPEVAGDAAYLMEKGTAEEIREAILFFLNDENRENYLDRGYSQAAKFGWDMTFCKTLAVYEEILGQKIMEG